MTRDYPLQELVETAGSLVGRALILLACVFLGTWLGSSLGTLRFESPWLAYLSVVLGWFFSPWHVVATFVTLVAWMVVARTESPKVCLSMYGLVAGAWALVHFCIYAF